MAKRKSAFLTDYYARQDQLRFSDFRPTLREVLTQADTPLTVGVFGPWGSGKTSLLSQLRAEIEDAGDPTVYTTWITAWKYDRHEALWRAFILRVLESLYPRETGEGLREDRPRLDEDKLTDDQKRLVADLDRLQESVYRPVDWQELGQWSLNWWQALKESGKAAAEIATVFVPGAAVFKKALDAVGGDEKITDELGEISKAFSREVKKYHLDQLLHMEQFERAFRGALESSGAERLIVFVDDLDRCLPEKAIEVLEAIKLFLEVPGTVFVLGMDKEVVERGIEARYGDLFRRRDDEGERLTLPIRGDAYLQKMVQIPFHLPPLSVDDIEDYISELIPPGDELISPMTRSVLARGLFPNPRQVKRILNIFRLLKGLVLAREGRPLEEGGLEPGKIAWPLLAKTILIQAQWPQVYRDWRLYPTMLLSLEEAYERQPISEETIVLGKLVNQESAQQVEDEADTSKTEVRQGGLLEPYLSEWRKYASLERLLRFPTLDEAGEGRERARFMGMEAKDLPAYVYLVSVATEGSAEQASDLPIAKDLLADMLSGDRALVRDAAERLQRAPESEQEYSLDSWRQALVKVLQSPQAATRERVSAGDALAYLGDPRFREDAWYLPDEPMLGFVEIPEGPFLMGSDPAIDPDAQDEEQPQHEVHLPTYFIARYPVTVAQFRAFVEDRRGRWQPTEEQTERWQTAIGGLPNHPVVYVTWDDARTYCLWLTERLRGIASQQISKSARQQTREFWRRVAEGGWGVNLPSEAEWEKAARGGLPSPEVGGGGRYPWGNQFDPDKANTKETGLKITSAVGVFPAGVNPLGILDLSGNVLEWTRSLYKPYPYDSSDGREEVQAEGARVLRGGSWASEVKNVRCAFRSGDDPRYRYLSGGFRCCLSTSSHIGSES